MFPLTPGGFNVVISHCDKSQVKVKSRAQFLGRELTFNPGLNLASFYEKDNPG